MRASVALLTATPVTQLVHTKTYALAPPLLHLEYDELFRNADGEIVHVEARGERNVKSLRYKADDIAKMLGVDMDVVLAGDDELTFIEGEDYETLLVKPDDPKSATLFLTFGGYVRVIVTQSHPLADHYREALFAAQFGTQEQRIDFAADLMKISRRAMRACLDTESRTMPTIYMFRLGTVGDLHEALELPADK